jgi:hypothetical protein
MAATAVQKLPADIRQKQSERDRLLWVVELIHTVAPRAKRSLL